MTEVGQCEFGNHRRPLIKCDFGSGPVMICAECKGGMERSIARKHKAEQEANDDGA